jgi:protein TonB
MKRFSILALLIPCAAFAQTTVNEARTSHHAVTVNAVPAGDDVIYDVAIRDLPDGCLLTSAHLQGKAGATVEKQMNAGAQRVFINVFSKGNELAYRVDIKNGDTLLDSIQSAPERRTLRLANAADYPPLRVGGDVKAPVVINRVEPVYPEAAKQSRISGIVILEVIIDRTGVVKDARVLKPLPFGLDQAAMDAVKQWTFRPGTFKGEPADVIFNLTINFRAPDAAKPEN